jgi:hypothetical protein
MKTAVQLLVTPAGVRGQQKKGELVLEAEEAGVVSQLLASLKGSNLQQQLMHEMDSKVSKLGMGRRTWCRPHLYVVLLSTAMTAMT